MPEMYKKICDKLGFEPSMYDPLISDTEDDTHENPFLKLSSEEIMYLYKNGYLSK